MELSELQAVTDAYFIDKKVTDIYFASNILLNILLGGDTGRKLVPGGKHLDIPLEYGEMPGQSFDAGTKFKTNKVNVVNKAYFNWAAYQTSIVYDLDDNRNNSGEAQIVDLIETKLRNGQKTLRKLMSEAVFTSCATSGKDIVGLPDLFNTSTSTAYGSIAEDDMAEWKANVITTSEAVSFSVMQKIRRAAKIDDDGEGKPNLYLTNDEIKDAFEATLQPQMRYSDAKLVKAGFDNILFGGKPVVAEDNVSAGIYGLNMNFLEMHTHKNYNFTKPVWANAVDTPETQVAFTKWSGQLLCKNRKAHCYHSGVVAESE
jgi:hypothetical protein